MLSATFALKTLLCVDDPGRLGTIEEVGRLALCIAAELTYTTGVEHIISGGAELGYGYKL